METKPLSTPTTTTTTTIKTTTTTRLKRESFTRTKHDTAFSKWRILIGATDWSNYESQIEGAERYRVANLPKVAGPGLYEIGVAVAVGREVEGEKVVVVYLGQADNVRNRLQHYGRSGSHLVFGFGLDLFRDVFLRGFSIVYRWALMKSKIVAERTEAQLLEKFDYAWNKLGNGLRRPDDILMKMDTISSKTQKTPKIWKMLQALRDQKVGIPIKAEKLPLENKPNHDADDEDLGLFGRVFKFSRCRPILVSPDPDSIVKDLNETVVCGVTSNDGKICIRTPVEGRKRCAEHKGMKLTSKSMTNDLSINRFEQENRQSNVTNNIICGVTKNDGTCCGSLPSPGRKRCMEHKGMRVNQTISKAPKPKSLITVSLSNPGIVDCCGMRLDDGKCCTVIPVKGRKRCEEHKGMRADANVSKLSSRDKWFNAELA